MDEGYVHIKAWKPEFFWCNAPILLTQRLLRRSYDHTMLRLLIVAFVATIAIIQFVSGAPAALLSFGDKYETVDSTGKRVINDAFTYGGTTEVKKNFIRITPDRQSKSGYIWSRDTINSDQLVAVLTYRIHGQGRKWFGDGIGVWFTHERMYANGHNHGFLDKYYGVGIILDTFKNVEHRGGHKDVTVQINDGTKTLDVLNDEDKLGCDAAFRYHAGSASFDPVYSTSRIRVKINGKSLEIDVDPRSEGKWTACYQGELPFTTEWLKRATIGLSASTGSLADNHDIIKLSSFDDLSDYGVSHTDAEVWTHNYSKDFDKLLESEMCDQNCKITVLSKFISNFQIETEHWFEELKESTQNTVTKLKEREQQNHKRIQVLTERMHSMVEQKVGQKVADVKSHVAESIVSKVEGELQVAGSSWRFPFFVLVVALAGAFGVAYQKYQKLIKNHLL